MTALSRRQALAGIGIAGTIAAVPVAANASICSAWNRAVARFNATKVEAEKLSARYITVHDAAEAACPRRAEFFSRYDMGVGASRERNVRSATLRLVMERTKERILSEAEAKETAAEANRVVDEFEAWAGERDRAFAGADELEKLSDMAHDAHFDARRDLLKLEAPHRDALLFKVAVLGDYLDECASEDAESFQCVRRDAFRLLSHGKA